MSGSPRQRRRIDWNAIALEYAMGATLNGLARKYGMARAQIRAAKKRYGWPDSPRAGIKGAISEGVPPGISEKIGQRPEADRSLTFPSDGQREAVAQLVANIKDIRTTALWKHLEALDEVDQIRSAYGELIKDWLSGDEERMKKAAAVLFAVKGDNLNVAIRTFLAATELRQRLEREALGIKPVVDDPKTPQDAPELFDDGKTIDAKKLTPDELFSLRTAIASLASQRPKGS